MGSNKEQSVNTGKGRIPAIFAVTALVALWGAIFFKGISTAVQIWYISEIFNHCFFVIPGAIFLIYRQRARLRLYTPEPNYYLLFPVTGLLGLYALGIAGDVQLFMHVATFGVLPFIAWMLLGNKMAREIAFPLLFILFCIPVGEELIPWLQQITADISVQLLQYSGVPVFRTGLYIEIPVGQFLVAEACSGISFFIASIVIGTLYSHLNIVSPVRKACFIGVSIVYPILANAIRVYGIIFTAYLTDMEYAAGADHIIYGGVFFSIVIISLLFIGELFREKSLPTVVEPEALAVATTWPPLTKATVCIAVLMIIFGLWYVLIASQLTYTSKPYLGIQVEELNIQNEQKRQTNWQPVFLEPEVEQKGNVQAGSSSLEYYIAFYAAGKGELVSSLNRLYHQDEWTIVSSTVTTIDTPQGPKNVYFEVISDPGGNERFLASWFVINEQHFALKRNAKLYQIMAILLGDFPDGALVAVSRDIKHENRRSEDFLTELQSVFMPLSSAAVPTLRSGSKEGEQ